MRFIGARRRTALVAALAVGGAGLLAPAAGGALAGSGWSEPVAVSGEHEDVWDVEVATSGRHGLAVWLTSTADGTQVVLARQGTDGAWAAPTPVAATTGATEVELAFEHRQGRARLAWTAGREVRTARLLADGSLSRPRTLHRTPDGALGSFPGDLRLAVNAAGAAALSWQTNDDDEGPPIASPTTQVLVRAGDGWGAVRTLSSPGFAGDAADVVVSRAGRVSAVWTEQRGRAASAWRSSYRPRTGWSEARRFGRPGTRVGAVRLVGRPSGRLAVASVVRSARSRGLAVRQWSRTGGWSRPVVVRGARMRSRLDLGISGRGVTAVFTDRRGGVRVAEVSRGGQVSGARLAPAREVFDGLRLAVNRAGDALVAWGSVRGGDHPVEAAHRPAAGAWGPVTEVTRGSGDAFLGGLAVRPSGQALAVWSLGEVGGPGAFRVWSSSHDAVETPAPEIGPRGIPARGAYAGATYGSNDNPRPMERQTGHRLGLRRTFWQADQVDAAVSTARADLAAGRLPWMSFKLPLSWEEMAAGRGDAWTRGLASRLAALEGPVWVAFHHEPETEGDIAAWRRMQERLGPIVRGAAPNVGFTVILTGWNQWYGPAPYRIESIWPRTTVDVAGFDVYNFHLSARKDGSVVTEKVDIKTEYFDRISAWARSEGVAWGLAETGQTDESFALDPGWMQRTFRDLEATGGVAMAYFNTPLNNYGSSWPLGTPEKQQAWGAALAAGVLPAPVP